MSTHVLIVDGIPVAHGHPAKLERQICEIEREPGSRRTMELHFVTETAGQNKRVWRWDVRDGVRRSGA